MTEPENPPARAPRRGPRAKPPTKEAQTEFLRLVSEGERKDHAAVQVGETATRFRSLASRDPEFSLLYEEAGERYKDHYRDRLRRELDERALDRADPGSIRILLHQAEAMLPEYAHKRTKHVKHGQDGPFEIRAIPFISQEKLAELPDDKLAELIDLLHSVIDEQQAPLELEP